MSENNLAQDISLGEEVEDEDYVSPLANGVVEFIDEESDDTDFDFGDDENIDEPVSFDEEDDEVDFNELLNDEDETVEGVIVSDDELVIVETSASEIIEAPELTVEEAKELTENIRSTANVLYALVARAHAGKAHLVLGYGNFADYVKAEFDISRSRAYQLLNQSAVIQAIEEVTPEGTQFVLSEKAARDLKNYVEELAPSIKERTEGMESNEAGRVVEEMVSDFRDKLKEEQEEANLDFDFDFDVEDLENIGYDAPDFSSDEGGGSKSGGGSEFDNMEGFDNLDDFGSMGMGGDDLSLEDPGAFREKIENVYAFYTALTTLEKMPSPKELSESIPEARRSHVSDSLPKAKAWLDAMCEHWTMKSTEAIDAVSESELPVMDIDKDFGIDFDKNENSDEDGFDFDEIETVSKEE